MSKSLMEDAFAHHVWATQQLIEFCEALSPEQLAAGASGTYGSVMDTMRHVVGADSFYVFTFTHKWPTASDPAQMDLAELRTANEQLEREWKHLLAGEPDPEKMITEVDTDGYKRDATVGLRLAQALHHGNDHRSQVCTALTTLGLEPPDVSVWKFGLDTGRSTDQSPTTQ